MLSEFKNFFVSMLVKTKNTSSKKKVFTFALLFLFLYSYVLVFAIPPSSPYLASDAVFDPLCAPGDTNCFVAANIFDAPLVESGGVVSLPAASASVDGYLSASDWNTFNGKQDVLTFGNLTTTSNPEITITGGTGAVIGTGLDISIPDASLTTRGLMTTTAQEFAGVKNFADGLGIGDSSPSTLFSIGTGGLFQVDASGDLVKINNINYTWPGAQGAADSVLVNDGSGGLVWASNGLTSLNGLTDTTQTFATSSTGTDFSITSSLGVHTFNFPTASATARGALTSTKYTEFNNKPFVDTVKNNIYTGSLSAGASMTGDNNIVFGFQAGDTLSSGSNNTFLGYQSGKSATTAVTNSVFIGRQAGLSATSASYATFVGRQAGQNATSAQYGIFIGDMSGTSASGSNNAIFIGQSAGSGATTAPYSTFIGTSAGLGATGATTATFIGYAAGYAAADADYANMIGRGAGNAATNAQYSNFLGFQSGYNATNAANSIFIGKNAGYGDTVNNTVSGSSIAIGDSAGTGGNSNSIALGASAINTLPNQFLIGSSYTNFNVRGINYVWPAAQAAGSGYVLTNDGSGGLSWSTGLSIGGTSGQLQYNNAGALGGVSGITFDGTNFDAKDNVFRIVDNSDTTKRAIFEVSGIDAGTTRTYTLPNTAGTIALTSDLSGYLKNSIGISGGTTLVGGTSSGENLTLSSTSNATKGKILFGTSAYDEVNNQLGIGTTTPSTALEIANGGTLKLGGGTAIGQGNILMNSTANAYYDTNVMYLGSNSQTMGMIASSTPAFNSTHGPSVFLRGNSYGAISGQRGVAGLIAGNPSSPTAGEGELRFFTGSNNTLRMVIGYNGNVGIGTTTPSTALEIANGGTLKLGGGTAIGQGNILMNSTASAAYDTNVMYLGSNSQTMGMIASSTPAFSSTYGPSVFLRGNSYGAISGQRGIVGLIAGNPSSPTAGEGELRFYTGSTNTIRMVIGYNGNVGIGTTSPGYKLDIQGAAAETSLTNTTNNNRVSFGFPSVAGGEPSLSAFTPGVTNGRIFQRQTSTKDVFIGDIDANGGGVHIRTNGNDSLNILSGGNVGIGTASPSYRFSVSDTTTAGIVGSFTNSDGTCTLDPGDVSGWSCPSDLNLKKDITTLTSGSLDNILALRPVTYRLINEDGSVDPSTGLIAQEVQVIFPKLVKTQIDGTLALNYGGLTPYVISAIQEMNLKIVDINNMGTSNTWRDALIGWFGNITNGIQKLFAKEVHTETLCVGETCLTETQVQQILEVIGSQSTPSSSGSGTGTTTGNGDDPLDDGGSGLSGSGTGGGDTGGTPDGSSTAGDTSDGTGTDGDNSNTVSGAGTGGGEPTP